MYGAIRRYRLTGNVDTVINTVKRGLLPLLEQTPGFVAYYVLKTTNDQATSFTVCENQSAVDTVNRVALEWVKKNLPTELSNPEVIAGELPVATVHQHV